MPTAAASNIDDDTTLICKCLDAGKKFNRPIHASKSTVGVFGIDVIQSSGH